MAFDQNLHSAPKSFPAFAPSSPPIDVDQAVAAFEDRLWSTAEAIIAAGAPSIAIVATAASLVRRQSERFASILSGAEYMSSLGDDGGMRHVGALNDDLTATQDRLIHRLLQDLSGLQRAA